MGSEYKFKERYNPKSNRLQNYDYSANGGYFITICTKERENYFGEIVDGKMVLNEIGEIVEIFYNEIPNHFPFVILDEFVIMPNHIHMILIISKNDDNDKNIGDNIVEIRQCLVSTVETNRSFRINRFQNQGKGTISSIIGSLKSICTKTINKSQNEIFFAWQTNYYDRIIRDEDELHRIRKYIRENPERWEQDKDNEENLYM